MALCINYISQIYLSSLDICLHLLATAYSVSPLGCFNRYLKLNMSKLNYSSSLSKPIYLVSLNSVDGISILPVAQVKTLDSSATTFSLTHPKFHYSSLYLKSSHLLFYLLLTQSGGLSCISSLRPTITS